ncbi:autophagy protein 16, interacts with Atg12p-Atg5p [Didymosphaeria variabile]|uniref:Autophagy protein 16, interacts with Atg12p-Atg5p n=1 Tax=Didymosphaeria variabile TaxID=1932322 RepID=A0A9W9CA23_9PLEO|nr:autophagy protein 16, interacts with Atg12p-Atg5p [Didymosphaeria variabile]KAJ4351236.1 autophagy protein 16, interacts with Atg12p-Atg5p [Didymosphaeria variabile]
MTTPTSALSKALPRDPMEEYLRSLEIRDRRERKHEKYINIITNYADKAAAKEKERFITEREASKDVLKEAPEAGPSDTKARSNWRYYGGKSSPTPSPAPADPAHITQLRADLASSNKVRSEQEIQLESISRKKKELEIATAAQARRIEALEKKSKLLEIRVKDTTEELKGQRQLAERAQDEMLVMQMEVNAKDKDLKKAEADVQMLTDRWMAEKHEDARRMNEAMEKGQKKR